MGYNAGVLASEWLANEAGDHAHIDFWRLLATKTPWQEAFSAAFGLTVDEFHEAFQEHLVDLLANLRRIEGVVVGPDGEPLTGVGVRAWHGGRVGSSSVETQARGAFAVRVWDGTYNLQITPDRSSWFPFAGWWTGEGLTADCDEAVIVTVEGSDVTGLLVRLPAGWDKSLPTLDSPPWECVALPYVRGRVLGVDGETVAGLGVWLWGGSTDSSKFGTTSADGTFDIPQQNGTFVLRVYVSTGEGWRLVGWYGGETGFTSNRADATSIEIDGTSVTGIEIRLPANPTDLRPVR
ncbi:MAG: carboxypeptidase regulatory-like domain-containing protein [Dehalococcoidia bacterium]|nr:carboxypeptidase regulatory-like domain-containing protein [Dehalococcoidia bacterium]